MNISPEALVAIVYALNANSRISLGRDCASLCLVREKLLECGLIRRVNLYDCEVVEEKETNA